GWPRGCTSADRGEHSAAGAARREAGRAVCRIHHRISVRDGARPEPSCRERLRLASDVGYALPARELDQGLGGCVGEGAVPRPGHQDTATWWPRESRRRLLPGCGTDRSYTARG